jgi:hypothetical protein
MISESAQHITVADLVFVPTVVEGKLGAKGGGGTTEIATLLDMSMLRPVSDGEDAFLYEDRTGSKELAQTQLRTV